MTIFFTADHHIGHARIVELCDRPFASIEEHDETLVQRSVLARRAARHAVLRDPRRDYDLVLRQVSVIYRKLRRSITGAPRRI